MHKISPVAVRQQLPLADGQQGDGCLWSCDPLHGLRAKCSGRSPAMTYRSLDDTGVIHHVEVASIESWVGGDQVRFTKLEGDTLTIKTPPPPHAPGRQTTCYHPGVAEERVGGAL